jgi:hypothetical protein
VQARVKQDELHNITLQRIAVKLDSGLDRKYIIGSDEFGMHLFPMSAWKWEKLGTREVKSLKADKRQYTGDIAMNSLGDVIVILQIWAGKSKDCLPHADVRAKFPHFLFTYSDNHWANLSTKIELAEVIWKWVVDQYFEDARKQGRAISRQEAEDTAQCVWLLDCW